MWPWQKDFHHNRICNSKTESATGQNRICSWLKQNLSRSLGSLNYKTCNIEEMELVLAALSSFTAAAAKQLNPHCKWDKGIFMLWLEPCNARSVAFTTWKNIKEHCCLCCRTLHISQPTNQWQHWRSFVAIFREACSWKAFFALTRRFEGNEHESVQAKFWCKQAYDKKIRPSSCSNNIQSSLEAPILKECASCWLHFLWCCWMSARFELTADLGIDPCISRDAGLAINFCTLHSSWNRPNRRGGDAASLYSWKSTELPMM